MDSAHTLTNNASKTNDYSKKKSLHIKIFLFMFFFPFFTQLQKKK